jgi:hypothetical protein
MIKIDTMEIFVSTAVAMECVTTSKSSREETMTIGVDINSNPQDVMHSFGHALGLVMAREKPISLALKCQNTVLRDMKNAGWAESMTRFFLTDAPPPDDAVPVDKESIMFAPYPIDWTGDDSLTSSVNKNITRKDKIWLQRCYLPSLDSAV